LNTATTIGGGVNDLLQVNGNLTLNNNTLSDRAVGASRKSEFPIASSTSPAPAAAVSIRR
jgi:hypothetical protein